MKHYRNITLSQYYNQKVKELGWNSFNHYCAEFDLTHREYWKKIWKKEYKLTVANAPEEKNYNVSQPEGSEQKKEQHNVR